MDLHGIEYIREEEQNQKTSGLLKSMVWNGIISLNKTSSVPVENDLIIGIVRNSCWLH